MIEKMIVKTLALYAIYNSIKSHNTKFILVGLDLSGGRSPTGIIALLEGASSNRDARILFADEIPSGEEEQTLVRIAWQHTGSPIVISVDAPLTCDKPFRDAEVILRSCSGIPMLPATFKGMRKLCNRARELIEQFSLRISNPLFVMETYPAAPRRICQSLHLEKSHLSDALIALAAARAFLLGEAYAFTDREALITIPTCPILEETLAMIME